MVTRQWERPHKRRGSSRNVAQELPDAEPFIVRFSSDIGRHVYDVNSNAFFSTDDIADGLLADWGRIPVSDLIAKYGAPFGDREVIEAADIIKELEAQGFFSTFRPAGLELLLAEDSLQRQVSSQLQHLILEVTHRCNLRCTYCVYSGAHAYQRMHSTRNMSVEVAKKAIDIFLERAVPNPTISFYGGEPLLNLALIQEVVEYASSRSSPENIRFRMTTNGTLLTPAITRFLVDHDVHFQVSIDGPASVHNRCRRFANGSATHAHVVRNLGRLLTSHPDYYRRAVGIACTIAFPEDAEEIHRFFITDLIAKSAAYFTVAMVGWQESQLRQSHPPSDISRLQALARKFVDTVVAGERPDRILSAFFERPLLAIHKRSRRRLTRTHYPNGICIPTTRRVFCTADGEFVLCERVPRTLAIGSVWEGIDGDRVARMVDDYAAASSSDCSKCWAVRLCSLCFGSGQTDSFSIETKRSRCDVERRDLLSAMGMYCEILARNANALSYMNEIELI